MKGDIRRLKIIDQLNKSDQAISATTLAKELGVSRQVIVQDVALLRANGAQILSTNRGYVLLAKQDYERVFKLHHTDEQTEEEMNLIVDYGGVIKDVFVYHKIYGTVRAEMNIHNRVEVQEFLTNLRNGQSSMLKNTTSGYHYHTVGAASEALLDIIMEKLRERGFLAQLQDYEPVNFWEA